MVNDNMETNSKSREPFLNLISKIFTLEEQKILSSAAESFKSGQYYTAAAEYRRCVNIIGKINVNNNEPSQVDVVVRYMLSKCLLQSSHFEDLLEARSILSDLQTTVGKIYPMVYYDLAEFYVRVFCFDEAERKIAKAFAVLGKKRNFIDYYLPGSSDVIPESTKGDLVEKLLGLREQCSGWHPPDAKCFMDTCATASQSHLCGKNIFLKSPAYSGMVRLTCSNSINPCSFAFHSTCWKAKKDEVSSVMKISDKEVLLNWECFTPNCGNDDQPSYIKRITIHKEDGTVKSIEPPPEKSHWHAQNSVSRGAVRKQKQLNKSLKTKAVSCESAILPPVVKDVKEESIKVRQCAKTNAASQEDDVKMPKEDPLSAKLCKLRGLRHHKFKRTPWNDWRPDRPHYGNRHFRRNTRKMWPCTPSDSKKLFQLKTFLFSYFYQYLKKNGPVTEDEFLQKWIETTEIIGNCQDIVHNLKCVVAVKEFFLQSLQFVSIGKYITVMPLMPQTYHRVRQETCEGIKYLMENPEANEKRKRIKKAKALKVETIAEHLGEKFIDEPASNLNVTDSSQVSSNVSRDEESFNTSAHVDYAAMEVAETPPQNLDESEPNGSSVSDRTVNFISQFEKTVAERQAATIEKLQKELHHAQAQLAYKKSQLADMKMRTLQENLDYQYIANNIAVTHQKEVAQSEYAVIMKLQGFLLNETNSCLTVDLREWAELIEQLDEFKKNLDKEYNELSVFVQSEESCMELDEVNLSSIDIPPLPETNVRSLIELAVSKLQYHYQEKLQPMDTSLVPIGVRLVQSPPVPPGFQPRTPKKSKVPAYIPPPIYRRIINSFRKDSMPSLTMTSPRCGEVINGVLAIPPCTSEESQPPLNLFSGLQSEPQEIWPPSNLSKQEDTPSSIIDILDKASSSNSDVQDEAVSSSANSNVQNDTVKYENWRKRDSSSASEAWSASVSPKWGFKAHKEDFRASSRASGSGANRTSDRFHSPALYKIMQVLRERHPDVVEEDLYQSLRVMRKVHGNSFRALGLLRIIQEIDTVINVKRKVLSTKKTSNSTTVFESPINGIRLVNGMRTQNDSASSTSSLDSAPKGSPWKTIPMEAETSDNWRMQSQFPSIVSKRELKRESKHELSVEPKVNSKGEPKKDNPWHTPQEIAWKKESMENHCVICMEVLAANSEDPTYTLKCQHTFHKTCIRDWFSLSRSCPTCRVHSTIDDEFPPLPS